MDNCYNKKDSISYPDMNHASEDENEMDERLTKKHIHTLRFLQEIVNENKLLKDKMKMLEKQILYCADKHITKDESKERIIKIQEDCLSRSDEINSLLIQRHKNEILQKVDNYLRNEVIWEEEKHMLNNKINDLNSKLEYAMKDQELIDQSKCIIHKLKLEINKTKEENMKEVKALRMTVDAQVNELNRLTSQDKKISEENSNLKSERIALKTEIKLLKRNEHLEFIQKQNEYEKLIMDLKDKICELIYDRKSLKNEICDFEYEILQKNESLEEMESLRMKILESDRIIQILNDEITSMKNMKLNEQGNFRDYIELKRELILVKNEYEDLKNRNMLVSRHDSLPKLLRKSNVTKTKRKLSLSDN